MLKGFVIGLKVEMEDIFVLKGFVIDLKVEMGEHFLLKEFVVGLKVEMKESFVLKGVPWRNVLCFVLYFQSWVQESMWVQ